MSASSSSSSEKEKTTVDASNAATATATATTADTARFNAERAKFTHAVEEYGLMNEVIRHNSVIDWLIAHGYSKFISTENQAEFDRQMQIDYTNDFPDADETERIAFGIQEWAFICRDYAKEKGYTKKDDPAGVPPYESESDEDGDGS